MLRRGSAATAALRRARPSGPSRAASIELEPVRPKVVRATLRSVHISLSCASFDSKMPTTVHSEPRMRTTLPISAPWN
jgi:hypothetical protein